MPTEPNQPPPKREEAKDVKRPPADRAIKSREAVTRGRADTRAILGSREPHHYPRHD